MAAAREDTPTMPPELIGRENPVDRLRSLMARASVSHGGLALITGEAGIGKTALVRRAADDALRQGMLVLRGACWDADGAPGHWPWTQAVRSLRRGAGAGEWRDAADAAGELLPVLTGEESAPGGPGDTGGFRLFDAVTSLLITASRHRPLLVVLEDLHRADPASLQLLEFAAQHTWFERILMVGTYRDIETQRPDHPLHTLLGPLTEKAAVLSLTGLSRDGTGRLITRTAGREPGAAVVDAVHERTGGNPFFVTETARLWADGHPVTAVSPGVRAAIGTRIALLGAPAAELLGAAAVLGRRFGPAALAATAGVGAVRAGELLSTAADARLILPEGEAGHGDGHFVFAHDLVREALYDCLGESRRRRLHAAAVRSLLAAGPVDDPARPAELARHARLAGPELDRDEAVALITAAARCAAGRLASEEAVEQYRRALARLGPDGPPRTGVLITLDLAAELQLTGAYERSWAVFGDALVRARGLGDARLLGRVALALHGADRRGDTADLRTAALAEAHRALTGARTGTDTLPGSGAKGPDRAVEVAGHVIGAARAAGDDDALHTGLWARLHAVWEPATAAERVGLAGELMAVSRRRADRWMEQLAASMRWVALLEQDDPAFLDQFHALVHASPGEDAPRRNMISVIDRSVVYAFTGRFGEAAELVAEATALSGRRANYYQFFVRHHSWAITVLRGDFTGAAELHSALRAEGHPTAELLAAITALERGERPPAAVPRPRPAGRTAEPAPCGVTPLTPLWLRYRAQAAAASGDPDRCERARADLLPYEGQWLVSAFGWDIGGPVSLWSGVLDAAQERWDDAVARFSLARRSADRLDARPWSVRARLELALALSARGGPGDGERAAELLAGVDADARELGMARVRERVAAGRPDRTAAGPGPAAAGPGGEFSRRGAVWRLVFAGRTAHLPDAKGLRDLHALLGQPGREIPAVRLLSPEGGELASAAGAFGGDPVLDDEARTRYRRRLDLLDGEIDRAAAAGDERRAAAYDRERRELIAELRRAAGLGGRPRRLGDETQRARKNVTGRIRDALRRMADHHPELAAHLRSSVSTGTACCYRPDGEIRWRL
ncbi:AAA family ATPase [Streptomyces sp. CAU 1734]|uniref:AAA family ATPase n=1 Tax=Streptomyces sp. CAU 1734 TaxID=3140360 RepID=UPI0032615E0D